MERTNESVIANVKRTREALAREAYELNVLVDAFHGVYRAWAELGSIGLMVDYVERRRELAKQVVGLGHLALDRNAAVGRNLEELRLLLAEVSEWRCRRPHWQRTTPAKARS